MKKTQWIDLWTTILRSKIPYLAIVILVTLGISLYGGMSWVCAYIDTALLKTNADNRFAHMTVVYPYGISDEQMEELLQIEGVDDVEGYNFVYRFFEQSGERKQAAIYQLTEHIDAPVVAEGTLPASDGEIAVLQSWADDNNVKVGDTVTFLNQYGSDYRMLRAVTAVASWDPDSGEKPDTDTSDPGYLKTNTFKVTALVEAPEYIMKMSAGYGSNASNGIHVDAVMYVSKEAMDPQLFNGYISAAIYSDTLAEMQAGSEYDAAYKALKSSVDQVISGWTVVPDKYNSVLENLNSKLEDAAKQINDAETEIEEKQKELEQGQQDYTDGQNTLASKWEEYNASKAQYESGLAQANASAAQLSEKWYVYNCLESDIETARDLINKINTFMNVMSEEESDTADEDETDTEDEEEADPADKNESAAADFDARADKAFSDVIDSAGALSDLLSSQSDLLSGLSGQFSSQVDFDKLGEACVKLIDSSTPKELEERINEVGDWFTDTADAIVGMVNQMYASLCTAQSELDQAYSQLNEAAAQLENALNQLNEGQAKLDAAASQIEEGTKALQNGREELTEKQIQYDETQKYYETMAKEAQDVYDVTAVSFGRDSNIALASAYVVRDIVWKARYIMASVFLLVAVFVGYTTLARMVADTKKQIGTKKALGFTHFETLRLYLLYAVSAVFLGALLGTAGAYGVEIMLKNTFTNVFEVVSLPYVIQVQSILVPFLIELILSSVAVIFAALRQLNRKTIDLLNGTDEIKKKSRLLQLKIFRKMPLFDRIIFSNLVQDKRRVISMLIGIGGAAMLITSGLTCCLNMGKSVNLEYERYFKFDTVIRYDSTDVDASSQLRELLDKYGVTYAEVYHTQMLTNTESGTTRISDVFVPVDSQELAKVMRFDTENAENTDYTDGFWVADFYSAKLGLESGSTVKLQSLRGDDADFSVTEFYKSYLPSLTMVVDMETWQQDFPDTSANAFLVNTDGIDWESLNSELYNVDGYICSIPFRYNSKVAFSAILSIVIGCAGTFAVMAVLLLIMMLINLLNMYITEKKSQLIILKINGYSGRQVKKYIWKDTLILTVVSILIGAVLGSIMGNMTQNALEGDDMLLYHGISWLACLLSAAIIGLIALFITLAELRKIKHFHLSDINN